MQLALGAEMVVEDRRDDAGARGDVLHLRGRVPVLGEDLHGRVEDADPPLLGRYPLPCHTE